MTALSLIKLPFYLFDEYLLITKLQLAGYLKTTPPDTWNQGPKGDFVLIHGLHGSYNSLLNLGNYLNKLGYKIHVLKEIGSNTQSVLESVTALENYIKSANLRKFSIICHSKGGLIAVYFLKTSKHAKKVQKVITIATPYKGSFLAKFIDRDIAPKSEIIRTIVSSPKNNEKIYNLYPHIDNHIVPNKNSLLEGIRNIKLNIVGHTRILVSERTINELEQIMAENS